MKVLITGGSGLLGRAITKKLLEKKVEVVHLTRSKNSASGVKTYEWDWENNIIDENCFSDVTHVIHLAGAGIAEKPWTMARKRTIIKSRVLTARLIHEKISSLDIPIEAFISASGIGYYGAITNQKNYSEEDKPHNDFIAQCCVQWEQAADLFNKNSRVVKFRLGIILDKKQGAIPKILGFIKKGIGSALGKGTQYMPWIHIEDASNLFIYALENKQINGTFNAVSNEHVDNSTLTKKLALANNRKIRLPSVPSVVVKLIYGELANILLEGVKVNNSKITEAGFTFRYKTIDAAFKSLFS